MNRRCDYDFMPLPIIQGSAKRLFPGSENYLPHFAWVVLSKTTTLFSRSLYIQVLLQFLHDSMPPFSSPTFQCPDSHPPPRAILQRADFHSGEFFKRGRKRLESETFRGERLCAHNMQMHIRGKSEPRRSISDMCVTR